MKYYLICSMKNLEYDTDIKSAIVSNGKVHDEVTEIVKKYLEDRK